MNATNTRRNSRSGNEATSVPSGPAFSNQPAIVVACFAGLGIWIVLILLVRWVIALINRMFGG